MLEMKGETRLSRNMTNAELIEVDVEKFPHRHQQKNHRAFQRRLLGIQYLQSGEA